MSEQYELIMPFLPVHSRGGPLEDNAYAAGYEMGHLAAVLAMCDLPTLDVTIHAINREQADLIAMKHNYVIETATLDDSGIWLYLKLRQGDKP